MNKTENFYFNINEFLIKTTEFQSINIKISQII